MKQPLPERGTGSDDKALVGVALILAVRLETLVEATTHYTIADGA